MLGNGSNYIEQPTKSHDKVTTLKNAIGQDAAKPFYIWANDDCANKCESFEEAKAIRLSLFNEGGEFVHIVDADGVEVVDSEIEAHEALAKAGYFVGTRNPEVKPEVPGAFMVNDPQDPDGFAIVGDDIASLILEARDHLLDPAPGGGDVNCVDPSTSTAEAGSSLVDGEVLGQDADGGLVQWNSTDGVSYNSGQTVEDFGASNLTEAELKRLNLSTSFEHPSGGKTGNFAARYGQHAERDGQHFTLLGAVDPKTYDSHECGPMYSIRFVDGVEIEAWPEEVASAGLAQSQVDPLCQSGHNPT